MYFCTLLSCSTVILFVLSYTCLNLINGDGDGDVDTICLFKTRLDKFWMHQGVIKPLFCVLEDELLSASDELLRETGQPHYVVRSHNEPNVAKVASCVRKFFQHFSNFSKSEIFTEISQKFTILETVGIAEPLQNRQHAQNP